MAITSEKMSAALEELGLQVEMEGDHFIHTTAGRFAPVLSSIITLDDDGGGATVMTAMSEIIAPEKRTAVYELLNLVHGQSLWNVRFHLDENGRVFSLGKHMLWGRPFSNVQFGDIFFTLLVTADRLYPCLIGINEEGQNAAEAFERFFLVAKDDDQSTDD